LSTTTKQTSKFSSIAELMKLRLASLVVFSASVSYLTVSLDIDWIKFLVLNVSGFLITGAANGFNQIIEKEFDILMDRTKNRPLPTNRLTKMEAFWACLLILIVGLSGLFYFVNLLTGILGVIAAVSYAVIYTPLKRITPFAVFVGAIPGAIPTMMGAVAATEGFGSITLIAWILFLVQFIWQFPHFWAIAWVSHEDYKKAGFSLLPSLGGRNRSSAYQILIYSLFLIPFGFLAYFYKYAGLYSAIVVAALGVYILILAYKLYKDLEISSARKLMLGSFVYLPIVQLTLLFGCRYGI
jgi:heme o synthase